MNEKLKDEKIRRLKSQLAVMRIKEEAQHSIVPYAPKKMNKEMDGFNQCLELIQSNRKSVSKWFDTQPQEFQTAIGELMYQDILDVEVAGDKCQLWLDAEDVFGIEKRVHDIEVDEVVRLLGIFEKFGQDGVWAFISHRLGIRPQTTDFTIDQRKFDEALLEMGR